MKEQFATLDISIKLKNLGFDEECFMVFDDLGYIQEEHVMLGLALSYTKAPLWQQVFDWFRNKKVLIEVSAIDSWDYWSATVYMEDCMSPFFVAFQDNEYEAKTYEEAREYAILKAIDLITK